MVEQQKKQECNVISSICKKTSRKISVIVRRERMIPTEGKLLTVWHFVMHRHEKTRKGSREGVTRSFQQQKR